MVKAWNYDGNLAAVGHRCGLPFRVICTAHECRQVADEVLSRIGSYPLSNIARCLFTHLLQVAAIVPCAIHRLIR